MNMNDIIYMNIFTTSNRNRIEILIFLLFFFIKWEYDSSYIREEKKAQKPDSGRFFNFTKINFLVTFENHEWEWLRRRTGNRVRTYGAPNRIFFSNVHFGQLFAIYCLALHNIYTSEIRRNGDRNDFWSMSLNNQLLSE